MKVMIIVTICLMIFGRQARAEEVRTYVQTPLEHRLSSYVPGSTRNFSFPWVNSVSGGQVLSWPELGGAVCPVCNTNGCIHGSEGWLPWGVVDFEGNWNAPGSDWFTGEVGIAETVMRWGVPDQDGPPPSGTNWRVEVMWLGGEAVLGFGRFRETVRVTVPITYGSIVSAIGTIGAGGYVRVAYYVDGIRYINDSSTHMLQVTVDNTEHYNPIFTSHSDVTYPMGAEARWCEGVAATWGYSTDRFVETDGRLTNVSLNAAGFDPRLSTTGVTFDRVGAFMHEFLAQDAHALSPLYPDDNTSATVERKITVKTNTTPSFKVIYATTAVGTDNLSVAGQTYSVSADSPQFLGEHGWTNQPLDISIDPDPILGTFDTVLSVPDLSDTIVSNGVATRTNYYTSSPTTAGTPITGVLTEVGETSNELSGTVEGIVKIDTAPPTASATHDGGFTFTDTSTDGLSGISTEKYKTQIAFTAPSASTTPPTTGWETLTEHTLDASGFYDVWVRATDRASNETITKTHANLYIGGNVSITKDTDIGADLHAKDCANSAALYNASDCEPECEQGVTTTVANETALAYQLTIKNHSMTNDATGTFEDYLPAGIKVTAAPTMQPSSVGSITQELQTSGIYEGRYKISGTYTNLAPDASIEITIPCEVDNSTGTLSAGTVLSSQASTDWIVGTGASAIPGSSSSNFANHAFVTIGVETMFQKVGAEDITTGLANAEFALYRWDSATGPSATELERLVDTSVVRDGEWQRVLENGETATDTATHFVSDSTGAVTLGNLEEGIYTLVETKAPSGYERPVGQWIMTIKPDNSDASEGNYKIEFVGKSPSMMPPAAIRETSAGVHTYKIINARPFSIGMSGLEGTKGILLVGFVLMALAGNAYVVYNHKQSKNKTNGTTEQM